MHEKDIVTPHLKYYTRKQIFFFVRLYQKLFIQRKFQISSYIRRLLANVSQPAGSLLFLRRDEIFCS